MTLFFSLKKTVCPRADRMSKCHVSQCFGACRCACDACDVLLIVLVVCVVVIGLPEFGGTFWRFVLYCGEQNKGENHKFW